MTDMVGLYITFWAAPGKIDALIAEVEAMLPVVAHESGTLAYGCHRVSGDLEGVSVYEIYRDAEAQRTHGLSAAIGQLKGRLPDFLGAPPERHDLRPMASGKGLPF